VEDIAVVNDKARTVGVERFNVVLPGLVPEHPKLLKFMSELGNIKIAYRGRTADAISLRLDMAFTKDVTHSGGFRSGMSGMPLSSQSEKEMALCFFVLIATMSSSSSADNKLGGVFDGSRTAAGSSSDGIWSKSGNDEAVEVLVI
jgi:hypothetical protein